MNMDSKVMEIHGKDPHEIAELEGMSELEFHEKLHTDMDFLTRCAAFSVDMSEEDFHKVLPREVQMELMSMLGKHGVRVAQRIKNPIWYGLKDFAKNTDEVMATPAKIIGYVSIATMVVFWAIKFYGLVFTK
jgi:hypothetical protein